jgi:PQQ-dependent catabolism-associated CXXCW motif protein
MLKTLLTAFALTLLPVAAAPSYAADIPLFTEDGYRNTLYRSPTPTFHEQAQTLEPSDLVALQQQHPELLLIDVYRNPWLRGVYTLQEQHSNLPNSLWLANCGDGVLDAQWTAYCQQQFAQATEGNKAHPIVFYCRSDCWLGWNAIKRADALGYSNLYWLRDGIDGWQQADLPLVPAQPVPFQ